MTPRAFRRMSAAVFVIAVATLLLAPAAHGQDQDGDEIPLLPEDRPSDFAELNLGPWSGNWVIESKVVGGLDLTSYFCSNEVEGHCIGYEYVADPLGSGCSDGCNGTDCSGPCDAEATTNKSKYGEGCTTDAQCPIDDTHQTCDGAKADSKVKADAACKTKGGAGCVCYAHSKVTSKTGKCKAGGYCRYNCTARSKGNCDKDW